MTVPTSLVLVGGYGSLGLALVGGGAEGFSNASMRAIMQRVSCTAPAMAMMVFIMRYRTGGLWWSW